MIAAHQCKYVDLRLNILARLRVHSAPQRLFTSRSTKSVDHRIYNIRGKHSRSTAYLRRENAAAMATQGDAGIPLSLLAEDQQQSFRLLELPAELLKLLTSDNPPT